MNLRTKLYLVLGVALITYGLARWQIVTELLSKQHKQFEQFFVIHTDESKYPIAIQEVIQLRKRVMLSGGLYPGWPQAIVPIALGLILLTTAYYFGSEKKQSLPTP